MKSQDRKPTHTIRVDDGTYKKLHRIAYKLDTTIIAVLHDQYVADLSIRKDISR